MKKFISTLFVTLFTVAAFANVAVLSYQGSTQNMKADQNNAELVNLNPDTFNVMVYSNGNNYCPGLNKDGSVRMYAGNVKDETTIGEGNIIDITLNYGVLDSVNINFLDKYDSGYDTTIADNTFSIKNVNRTNQQVRFDTITIYYTIPQTPTKLEYVTLDNNKPMYNIYGMPVDNSYKGIIIQDNKKFIKH